MNQLTCLNKHLTEELIHITDLRNRNIPISILSAFSICQFSFCIKFSRLFCASCGLYFLILLFDFLGENLLKLLALIRVHKLLTACDKYKLSVDTGSMPIRAAVELSYLSAHALEMVYELYHGEFKVNGEWCDIVTIDIRLAEKLREHFKDFDGDIEAAKLILKEIYTPEEASKRLKPIKLDPGIRSRYFTADQNEYCVNEIIGKALEMYFNSTNEKR